MAANHTRTIMLAAGPDRAAVGVGAAVVGLLGAGFYLATLAPGLGGTVDSAEFQHAAYNLDIVHPTGYPLYLLLARSWIAVFAAGDIAWRVNLLSAVYAVAALLVVYATVVMLTRSPFGGVLAAGLLGTHALVWETAVVAEVNSLSLLLVAAASYALLRWAGVSAAGVRRWPLEIAALLGGLALSHHRTSALLLPGSALCVLWMIRRGAPSARATAARSILLLLLPWLLYLYLPLRAGTTPWYTNTWANFAAEMGGATAWPVILDTIGRPLLPRVGIVWTTTFPTLAGTTSALVAAAGLSLWAGRPRPGWRAAGVVGPVVALYGLGFLTVCGMMVIYDVDVIGDYLTLALLAVAVWAGVAAAWVLAALRTRRVFYLGRVPAMAAVVALLLILLPAAQVQANYAPNDFSHYDEPRRFWNNVAARTGTLDTLPPQSIVVGGWSRYNELRYLQTVEGWRPDLYPVVLDDLTAGGHLDLIDKWLAQQRAVFLLDGTPDVLDHFAAVQHGPIWRIARRSEVGTVSLRHPLDITFGADIRLLGYTLDPEQPRPGGQVRITLFWQTRARLQERYAEFTHLVDDNLHKIGQRDDEPGRGYRPTTNWAPGVTVQDTLVMPIVPAAAPGTYRLIVGLYTRLGEKRLQATDAAGHALGDYWEMTAVRVSR